MQRVCPVCLETKEVLKGETKCASCVHSGYSRKISPENKMIIEELPTIQDLKRKWEKR